MAAVARLPVRRIRWAGVLGLLLGLVSTGPVAADPETPQLVEAPCRGCNLLWIVMDTTRADRLGVYGNSDELTPNLDRLARGANSYRYAFAQGPETFTSASSYLTGRYRQNNGMTFGYEQKDLSHALAPDITTVAQVFAQHGWHTVGRTANNVLNGGTLDFDLDRGFADWRFRVDRKLAEGAASLLPELAADGGADGSRPFVLYLHFMGPHVGNARLPGFEERHGHFDTEIVDADTQLYRDLSSGTFQATDQDLAYLRALYDDAVWQTDGYIGQVLDALDSSGLSERTVVIFTSDHGEFLGEISTQGPYFGHSNRLFATLLQVPLIVEVPGLPDRGMVEDEVVELVDLAPTLTDVVGIPRQASWGWDGVPFLGPRAVSGQWAISERGPTNSAEISARDRSHQVRGSLAYGEEAGVPTVGRLRAFRVDRPDGERQPGAMSPRHGALKAHIEAYLEEAQAPEDAAPLELSEEAIETLRALGYLE